MSTAAVITLILVQGTIISITGYLFYKVFTTDPNPEPDSYSENDDQPR